MNPAVLIAAQRKLRGAGPPGHPPFVPQDNGIYVPDALGQFAALGYPEPDAGWIFQEASGNFLDKWGTNHLVNTDMTYQQAGPSGWLGYFAGSVLNGVGAKLTTDHTASAQPVAWLGYYKQDATTTDNRSVIAINGSSVAAGVGRQLVASRASGVFRVADNGVLTDGSYNYEADALVHPLLAYYDPSGLPTTNVFVLSSDKEQVNGSPGLLATNTVNKGPGSGTASTTSAAGAFRCLYLWKGADATAVGAAANAKAFLQALKWTVTGY